MNDPDYKGHGSLAEMISGHIHSYRSALKFKRGHAKDSDDRSYVDHQLSALDDIEAACKAELAKATA